MVVIDLASRSQRFIAFSRAEVGAPDCPPERKVKPGTAANSLETLSAKSTIAPRHPFARTASINCGPSESLIATSATMQSQHIALESEMMAGQVA